MLPALRALLDDIDGDVHVVASGDPLLHGIGGTLIRLFGADRVTVLPHVSSVTLACARVGLGGAGHRGDQPGHRRTAHRGAPRRAGRRAVARRSTPATLARLLDRRTAAATPRFTRARTTRRTGRAPPRRHRTGLGGRSARRRRRPQRRSPCTTCPTSACRRCPTTRSSTTGRSPSRPIRAVTLAALAPRPGELLWDVGAGSGSIAVEWCRSRARLRGGGVRTRRAAPHQDRIQRSGIRRPSRRAGRRAGRLRRRARPRRRSSSAAASPSRGCSTPASTGCLPAAGWSPTPSPPNRKPFSRSGIRDSAASCVDSSTTTASRLAGSPAGVPRCPSRSGR